MRCLFGLLICAFAGLLQGCAEQIDNSTREIVPRVVGMDAPEIVNPMRGLYKWRGMERCPTPVPAFDAYERFEWRDLEPQPDQYDFAPIESFLSAAQKNGQKGAFRLRCVVSRSGLECPDYITNIAPKGFWFVHGGGKHGPTTGPVNTYCPDWNDPAFLERAEKLLAAIGQRYDGDKRLAWIDIGIYGNWGEWHCHKFPYPNAGGAEPATSATLRRIADAHINAFPNTRLIMMSDSSELEYVLGRSEKIGWRRDSLANPHFADIQKNKGWELAKDRWKTAPVITEFFNPPVLTQAIPQILDYHVAMVGNGNTARIEPLSAEDLIEMTRMGKLAGYRFELRRVLAPGQVKAGGALQIQSQWVNSGIAPAYEDWEVTWQLRDSKDNVVCSAISSLDLQKLLPASALLTVTDSLQVPDTLPEDAFRLALTIKDPSGYRKPLTLPLAGWPSGGVSDLMPVSVSR